MKILVLLFPHQLFSWKYVERIGKYMESDADADADATNQIHICLWEHPYFFTKYPYHQMKLVFHRATMKQYYETIPAPYNKHKLYVEWHEKETGRLTAYIRQHGIDQIRVFHPIEKEIVDLFLKQKILRPFESRIFPSPYFLNSREHDRNAVIEKTLTSIRHDTFYKYQRIYHDVMVTHKGERRKQADTDTNVDLDPSHYIPEGNHWTFDKENRLPFEKSQTEPPQKQFHSKKRTGYLKEAAQYVSTHFANHYGQIDLDQFIYPISHEEAKQWISYFIAHRLKDFGKYEDAMSSHIQYGYHSVFSPLTNIGLITPNQIVEAVRQYRGNQIASKEGFIRQVIGWREYCYFTYDLYGSYLKSNTLYGDRGGPKKKIPEKVWKAATQIPVVDDILKRVAATGYSHHIERLMGIGNFLILIDVSPDEMYRWFQTMYIDAYDVFMVPNVYGMLCYGQLTEDAHMMTRPYFASSNYWKKMSDYRSEESVEIGGKKYKWDDVMDALYWMHVSEYAGTLKKIYATASAVATWGRIHAEKKKEMARLANLYKTWIHGRESSYKEIEKTK